MTSDLLTRCIRSLQVRLAYKADIGLELAVSLQDCMLLCCTKRCPTASVAEVSFDLRIQNFPPCSSVP